MSLLLQILKSDNCFKLEFLHDFSLRFLIQETGTGDKRCQEIVFLLTFSIFPIQN